MSQGTMLLYWFRRLLGQLRALSQIQVVILAAQRLSAIDFRRQGFLKQRFALVDLGLYLGWVKRGPSIFI